MTRRISEEGRGRERGIPGGRETRAKAPRRGNAGYIRESEKTRAEGNVKPSSWTWEKTRGPERGSASKT